MGNHGAERRRVFLVKRNVPTPPPQKDPSYAGYLVVFTTFRRMEFRFVYTGLRVRDIERSLQFYTEILGMEVVDPLESYEPTRGKAVTGGSPVCPQSWELNCTEGATR